MVTIIAQHTSNNPASILTSNKHHRPTVADSGTSNVQMDDINTPIPSRYFDPILSASRPPGI